MFLSLHSLCCSSKIFDTSHVYLAKNLQCQIMSVEVVSLKMSCWDQSQEIWDDFEAKLHEMWPVKFVWQLRKLNITNFSGVAFRHQNISLKSVTKS